MDFDFRRWLDLASHYPDLIALLVGTLVGYVFTVSIEAAFLPIATTDDARRKQKGLTFIMCWLASGTASAILWVLIDPSDPPRMRLGVSYLVSVLSFSGYPLIAKVGTAVLRRFGINVGSAWVEKPP